MRVEGVIEQLIENMPSKLVLLKYAGLILAASSSIWATTQTLTVTSEQDEKKLTRAGFLAIILTITGLVISIYSEDQKAKQDLQAAVSAARMEAHRTNAIIMAGQPLSSLELRWDLRNLNRTLSALLQSGHDEAIAFIEDEQGERSDGQNSAVFREKQLYPLMASLGHTLLGYPGESQEVIGLIALNEDASVVLPFGYLSGEKPWNRGASSEPTAAVPPSIQVGPMGEFGASEDVSWARINSKGSSATIGWRLDPATLKLVMNKQNEAVGATAKLPEKLRIALLFNFPKLPFEPGNFAAPIDRGFWNFREEYSGLREDFRGQIRIRDGLSSSIRLVPNGSIFSARDYVLRGAFECLFQDSFDEPDPDIRCVILEFEPQDASAASP